MRRKHASTTTLVTCWKRRSWRASTCRVSKDEFLTDRRTQQAVVLNLMTIGEAAARIVNECKDFAAAHPEIPWAQMRGMRNRMAHGYFDIDLNTAPIAPAERSAVVPPRAPVVRNNPITRLQAPANIRDAAVNLPLQVSPGQTRIFLRLLFEQTLDRNPKLRV